MNWFDITEPEGCFSLNDTMGTIFQNEQAGKVLAGFMSGIQAQMNGGKAMGFEMNEGMLKMMEGFTIVRMANLMGTAGVKVTKEQLLEINNQLNQIRK